MPHIHVPYLGEDGDYLQSMIPSHYIEVKSSSISTYTTGSIMTTVFKVFAICIAACFQNTACNEVPLNQNYNSNIQVEGNAINYTCHYQSSTVNVALYSEKELDILRREFGHIFKRKPKVVTFALDVPFYNGTNPLLSHWNNELIDHQHLIWTYDWQGATMAAAISSVDLFGILQKRVSSMVIKFTKTTTIGNISRLPYMCRFDLSMQIIKNVIDSIVYDEIRTYTLCLGILGQIRNDSVCEVKFNEKCHKFDSVGIQNLPVNFEPIETKRWIIPIINVVFFCFLPIIFELKLLQLFTLKPDSVTYITDENIVIKTTVRRDKFVYSGINIPTKASPFWSIVVRVLCVCLDRDVNIWFCVVWYIIICVLAYSIYFAQIYIIYQLLTHTLNLEINYIEFQVGAVTKTWNYDKFEIFMLKPLEEEFYNFSISLLIFVVLCYIKTLLIYCKRYRGFDSKLHFVCICYKYYVTGMTIIFVECEIFILAGYATILRPIVISLVLSIDTVHPYLVIALVVILYVSYIHHKLIYPYEDFQQTVFRCLNKLVEDNPEEWRDVTINGQYESALSTSDKKFHNDGKDLEHILFIQNVEVKSERSSVKMDCIQLSMFNYMIKTLKPAKGFKYRSWECLILLVIPFGLIPVLVVPSVGLTVGASVLVIGASISPRIKKLCCRRPLKTDYIEERNITRMLLQYRKTHRRCQDEM
ncbi:uncharacterized protein LOC144450216 [Glandiceps talaboti]